MKKAHFIYTEGITRYAPKGKSFIQGSISFEEPLTLEEFDKFNKCMYISNEDLQQRIDKAVEIYKNKNTCKYKKQRFMEDKTTADLMYEAIKGSEE